jgi:hypothetical protein
VQTTGEPAAHAPLWHVSLWVHGLPSLHAAPFAFGGFEQAPVDGLQVPASWHWSDAAQTTGFAPAQAPPCHTSECVQALTS